MRVDAPAASRTSILAAGELDLGSVPQVASLLDRMVEVGYRQVDLDLRQVTFCDVAGLNLLLDWDGRLRAHGGRLVLLGPCPALQVLLNILGLDLDVRTVSSSPTTAPSETLDSAGRA